MQPVVLPMVRADLARVQAIAEAAFHHPWPAAEWEQELARPFSVQRVVRAASGAPVVGFVVYWVLGDTAEIMHVAVAAEARGQGLGRALMQDAFVGAKARGCMLMSLEVRASNSQAIGLYTGLGFARIGVRPRYYSDNGEDAAVMQRAL